MMKATQTAQATWLMILSLLSQVAVWVAFTSQYVDSRQMDSACRSNVPDGAVFVGETTPVVEDVTFLPIGRACTYEAVNGGTIAVQTGQLVTAVALAGTAVCLIAATAAWTRWNHLTPMRRLLPVVGLLFLALGWVAIGLQAAMR